MGTEISRLSTAREFHRAVILFTGFLDFLFATFLVVTYFYG